MTRCRPGALGVVAAAAVLLAGVAAGYTAIGRATAPGRRPPAGGEPVVTLTPGRALLAITDRHVSTVVRDRPRRPAHRRPAVECLRCTPPPAPASA